MKQRYRFGTTVLALTLAPALALTGCGADQPAVEAGPDAGNAACTALIARLPERVLDRARTGLDVPGAAAWGDDPPIVLRCGIAPAGPTSDPCLESGGVDWTFSETKDDYRFVAHGRTPAVEVLIPAAVDRTVAPAALVDLAPAVKPLPQSAPCTA